MIAAGGIASNDPMTMQIYADVCNREIKVSGSSQSGALGSAIFGAVAGGPDKSGYQTFGEAANKLGKLKDTIYKPIPSNVEIYNTLFSEYLKLHDYFGRGGNDVMKRLKRLKDNQRH